MESFTYQLPTYSSQIYTSSSGLGRIPNYNYDPECLESPTTHRDIVSACRSLYQNNGVVRAAIDMKAIYSIGNAFKLYSLCENTELRQSYTDYLEAWQKVACTDNKTFNDLLFNISTSIDVDGDCFVMLTKSKQGFPQ